MEVFGCLGIRECCDPKVNIFPPPPPPQLKVAAEDGRCVTFQKVLLSHCQSQFEKNQNEEMLNIQAELDVAENVSVALTRVTEHRPLVLS